MNHVEIILPYGKIKEMIDWCLIEFGYDWSTITSHLSLRVNLTNKLAKSWEKFNWKKITINKSTQMIGATLEFKNKEDAMAFKLRWL